MARWRTTEESDPTARRAFETWREVIRAFDDRPLIVGGKSMGGRIASMVADEMSVAGVVCLDTRFIRRVNWRNCAQSIWPGLRDPLPHLPRRA